MVGFDAGEVVAVVQTAMPAGLPHGQLRDVMLGHPTMAESLDPLFSNPAAPLIREQGAGRERVSVGMRVRPSRHADPGLPGPRARQPDARRRHFGSNPERRDYAGFADFANPDANTWIRQDRRHRGR